MEIEDVPLRSRHQTGRRIYALARKFKNDLQEFQHWSLDQFYDLVHSIPFSKDPVFTEIVSRPSYLLDPEIFPVLDCKKKTTLLAAFFELQNWDYILVASSDNSDDPHHVFILLWDGEDWLPVDATLNEDYLFAPKPDLVHGEIL